MQMGLELAAYPVQPKRMKNERFEAELSSIPSWSVEGNEIQRTFVLGSFREAVTFVQEVAVLAEKEDHHPHIAIDFRKVTLRLSTHSEGCITEKDFALSRACDALV